VSRHREGRAAASDRARRAVACLLVAAEILVVVWAGAGTVTVECRLLSPFGQHRFAVTVGITPGGEIGPDRPFVARACPVQARFGGDSG
jgi:hypothetical protein